MTPALAPISLALQQSLVSSYENLRQNALGGAATRGGSAGLAVFLRGGMAHWMDACRELPAACPLTTMKPGQTRAEDLPILDGDLRAQVAILLAQMALSAHTQGATTC